MSKPVPPIFIVGAPRSGTTLLAAMFGSHPDYAAGPESQFFSKLNGDVLQSCGSDPQWPAVAVEAICRLTLAEQPVAELFETSAQEIRARLEGAKPSIAAMLEALTVSFAEKRGKSGWVEKTPNHILNLAQIRKEWPEARIIRILRDPRDSVVSTCKLPTFSDSPLANAYIWREWQEAGDPFVASDLQATSLRYEDLMASPEAELQRICDAIDIPFDPAMLSFQDAASDVSSEGESWKMQVSDKLDASRVYSWKRSLEREMADAISLVCHEWLDKFGYETGPEPQRTVPAFGLSPAFVERFEPFLMRDAHFKVRWLEQPLLDQAHHVFDHPRYYRFRNPAKLLRLAMGRRFAKKQLKRTEKWQQKRADEEAVAASKNWREPA